MKLQSISINAVSPTGWPVTVCALLDDNEKATAAIDKLTAVLESKDYKPAPTVATAPSVNDTALTFAASTLSTTFDEGKQYFKVRGAQFSKFGVAIYPEMLQAAGIEPETVDPREPLPLDGYTAFYVLNENGKPRKVTKLVKG